MDIFSRIFKESLEYKIVKYAMSVDEAFKTLDLPKSATPEALKKQYRTKAIENHPDRGGDEAKMKKINEAKEILDSYLKRGKEQETAREKAKNDWEERKKKEKQQEAEALKHMKADAEKVKKVMNGLKAQYIKHILDHTGKEVRMFVKEEIKDNGYGFDFGYKFKDPNSKAEFDLKLSRFEYPWTTDKKKDFSYESTIFYENKQYRMQKSRYTTADNLDFFKNPEKVFPKARLKKIFSTSGKGKVKKLTRKDYEARLINEVFAKRLGDYWRIPLKDDLTIGIYRIVVMGFGSWNIGGLYKGHRQLAKPVKYHSFYETSEKMDRATNFEDFIDFLKKAKAGRLPDSFWKYNK